MARVLSCPVENGSGGGNPRSPAQKAKNGGPERNQKQIKILVVDDESIMRSAIGRPLRREIGRENVLEAENGKVALELLLETDNNFDLIILDLNMPEMGGTGVVMELEKLGRHDIIGKIVIHSGTLAADLTPHVRELVKGRVLQKPTRINTLMEVFSCAEAGNVNEWRPPAPKTKGEL